jgi:hypothetical protein
MTTHPDARKRCKAKTRAGNPCRAWPLEGGKLCLAHDVKARDSVRFSGAQPGAGRPAKVKASDLQRQLVEQNILVLWEPHFATLGYRIVFGPEGPELERLAEGGAMLHGTSQRTGEIVMSEYPDVGARQAAAERLLNRVLGTPRQSMAVSGADGGPILLRIGEMLTPETAKLAAELADRLALEDSLVDDPSAGAA